MKIPSFANADSPLPISEIYFASIIVDAHRWVPPRQPAVQASSWIARAASAGFDGVELWEFHWLKATESERSDLRAAALPIRIFNSYVNPGTASDQEIEQLRSAVQSFSPSLRGIKFNLGGRPSQLTDEITAALTLEKQLPSGLKLYCECHPDTVVDEPLSAGKAFAGWPADRFAAILHPFFGDDASFAAWLRLGERIEHLHLQMRNEDFQLVRIVDRPKLAERRLRQLFDHGFCGSVTIEFTAGVGTPPENLEEIWSNALGDLEFVRKLCGRVS